MKYAARILVCIIAISKSQFLLKIRGLCTFFSTTTQGIRLRRRVDVFSTTSYTSSHTHNIIVADTAGADIKDGVDIVLFHCKADN